MNETLATYVTPSTTSSVVRIDTAAISSGTSASSDANTNASTASAPSAPNIVSANTPGPLSLPESESSCRPVRATVYPGGSARRTSDSACFDAGAEVKPFGSGENTYAKIVRPSFVVVPGT